MMILNVIALSLFVVGIVNMLFAIVAPRHIHVSVSGHSVSLFSIAAVMMTISVAMMIYMSHSV
jgi:hypothetical protein